MLVLLAGAVLIGVAFGWVYSISNRADSAASDIQTERVRSIRDSCVVQNERNTAVYIFLAELPTAPGQPRRAAGEQLQGAQQRLLAGFTNALAGPYRDCDVVVQRTAPSAS